MTQLKSLAHPNWPYAGTPNEWRGFAEAKGGKPLEKDAANLYRAISNISPIVYQNCKFGPELK